MLSHSSLQETIWYLMQISLIFLQDLLNFAGVTTEKISDQQLPAQCSWCALLFLQHRTLILWLLRQYCLGSHLAFVHCFDQLLALDESNSFRGHLQTLLERNELHTKYQLSVLSNRKKPSRGRRKGGKEMPQMRARKQWSKSWLEN